jgi:hypothetical protein
VLAAGLLLAGLCAVALGLLLTARSDSEPAAPPRPTAEPEAQEPAPLVPRIDLGMEPRTRPEGTRPSLEERPTFPAAERFRGNGRIEGFLDLPPGVAAPRPWTLVLEPSQVLMGGEHAERRRIVFEHGETEFTLEDVALGGYELRAVAERMSGPAELLLLARPDSQRVIVHVALQPAAFVEGLVEDATGAPVADLPLHLHLLAGGEQRTTHSDARGAYLFEDVPDGEYRLFAGHPMSPVVPALDLAVSPPSLHVPRIVLPPLGEIRALVVDADGLPVAEARVEGWGANGGRVEVRTDAQGEALQRFLPAGRYNLRAWAGVGPARRTGRSVFELTAGGTHKLRIQLDP